MHTASKMLGTECSEKCFCADQMNIIPAKHEQLSIQKEIWKYMIKKMVASSYLFRRRGE